MIFRLIDNVGMRDIEVIDYYTGVLWVEKYNEAGEFILTLPSNVQTMATFTTGRYIWSSKSDTLMIIESRKSSSDPINGDILSLSGRSLMSILDRRIVWKMTTLNGTIESVIEKLLNENLINPSDPKRKIPNFIFRKSTDARLAAIKIDMQVTGSNLYSTIANLCQATKVGFKVSFDGLDKFIFELYMGHDRGYDQEINEYVVFSNDFDNLRSSEYVNSTIGYANVALIAGEDKEDVRITATIGSKEGMNRSELYVDARDIQSEIDEGIIPPAEYKKLLITRGEQYLKDHKMDESVIGEVEIDREFIFGEHYFLGDLVQLSTSQGIDVLTRITESVYTRNVGEESHIPTFVIEERSDDE